MKYFRGTSKLLQQHERNLDIDVYREDEEEKRKEENDREGQLLPFILLSRARRRILAPTKNQTATIFEHETSTPRLRAWRAKHAYDRRV
jgi:hypothetical protein